MTKRQQAVNRIVQNVRDVVIEQAEWEFSESQHRGIPIGHTVVVRLAAPLNVSVYGLQILVTKDTDGYSWVEHDPLRFNRKGRSRPKPRIL